VNENAWSSQTYLGNEVRTQGQTAFPITPQTIPASDFYSDGLPTFTATLGGVNISIGTIEVQNYYIDFISDHIYAWNNDCRQTVSSKTYTCSGPPTYANSAYINTST